jgi:tripartite-type tricarboxylate transporter receptor subunit TctC
MKTMKYASRKIATCTACCAALLCCGATQAEFPDKPIRFVVAQAAGSASDTVARALGIELSKQIGQQVIIDNRPGGALVIGMEAVARAAPDGYTIGLGTIGAMTISPALVAKLPYNVERDFQPITLITIGHLLLAASPTTNIMTVRDLIDQAKAKPDGISNASSGNGTPGHVGGELFKYMSGTRIVHVPYKGGAAAINDLMAGQVQVMFESLGSIAPFAKQGRVRPLGVSGARRSPGFPDIPTIAEAGVPGYEAPTWTGVITPAGVPRPIVMKLNTEINKATASNAFRQRWADIGDEAGGGTPEEFGALVKKESAKWVDVARRSGAKID